MIKFTLFIFQNLFLLQLYIACLLSARSCGAQATVNKNGIVILNHQFFEPRIGAYVKSAVSMPDAKVWYKDSLFIEEILSIRWEQDYGKPEKRWVELIGYTFIDLPNRAFYHYKTFSDTAAIIAKWTQPDSTAINDHGGIWNFWKDHWIELAKPLVILPDTVQNGIVYKRALYQNSSPFGAGSRIAYFRVDKKGTMFQLDKALSEKMGCPLTKTEPLPEQRVRGALTEEVKFVKDKLSDDELKVFAAWEKNARINPVRK